MHIDKEININDLKVFFNNKLSNSNIIPLDKFIQNLTDLINQLFLIHGDLIVDIIQDQIIIKNINNITVAVINLRKNIN